MPSRSQNCGEVPAVAPSDVSGVPLCSKVNAEHCNMLRASLVPPAVQVVEVV